ncbi:hydroxysteroid (20-beta) dehydrogenase 2 [Nerophis ophidion]|uniref:hydroxysteroid (20-beta) dehydrogenase 2 n=1 Tax=Nerophis ophidion TaxID=159077 RepID=UPI002ADF4863|nr:hydroxysteroid (20-beta) dehydrogenase 2 [Nerophis ophidion]
MSSTDILQVIGGFTLVFFLLKMGWKCWRGFREFIWSEFWRVDLRTYGQWAVVTGATSGIGKAYALELAQRGLNVVLVSRCGEKLRQVAKEIEGQYGQKTCTIRVDFTHKHNIYPFIAKQLQDMDIGILVNNVAMSYSDDFASFLEIPNAEQKITEVINCNTLSVAQTTRLVLPGMLKRNKGLIINISSQVGIHAQPLLALYSATKAFVIYFSQCLHAEYKSKGITVQCVMPFLVSTNMNKMKSSCWVKSAASYAREALNTVGYSNYTSGCLVHAMQSFAFGLLMPDWLRFSSAFVAKLHHAAQKRKAHRGAGKDECTLEGMED